jgi:hypothetical protein
MEGVSDRTSRSSSRWAAVEAVLAETDRARSHSSIRGSDRDISGPGSVASSGGNNTLVGAAEFWPKWAVAA